MAGMFQTAVHIRNISQKSLKKYSSWRNKVIITREISESQDLKA